MPIAADRPEFAPPPQPGLLRAFVLAVLAHLLLVAALMHGLQWQRETQDAVAEAELWSSLPQEAAPREQPAPPPPPPAPAPVVKAPPVPEPPANRDADIALEREKKKRELEREKQAELERERRLEAQKEKQEALEKERRLEAQKKKREEEAARRKEEQLKLAEAKKKEDEKRQRQQEQEAKRLADLREENMRRMQGMAGTGAPSATGNAQRSAGPSATWGSRVQARVRPNITFAEVVVGNPEAVVEVRLAPDGTIVSKRIKKSSGHKGWDDAVLRALDKTEVLPRDTDGSVPSGGELVFKPKG
jgi:colicin import membrane protein